MIHNDNTINDI